MRALALFLMLRFNQNVPSFGMGLFFVCVFKMIVLTREETDNQGLQKLEKLIITGNAAMFVCTKRKK